MMGSHEDDAIDVFIAYPSPRRDDAGVLYKELQAFGLSVFMDMSLPGGAVWSDRIKQVQLRARSSAILLLSDGLVSGWLRGEINVAVDLHNDGHLVFPIWTDGAPERPIRLCPSGLESFDIMDAQARGWQKIARTIAGQLTEGGPPAVTRQRRSGDVVLTALTDAAPMRFRYVRPDKFWMGRQDYPPDGSEDAGVAGRRSGEKPRRAVTLSAFAMAETPVTQAQWRAVAGTNPSHFAGRFDSDLRPVENVSWFDTVRWCNALSELEGRQMAYQVDETLVNAAEAVVRPDDHMWSVEWRSDARLRSPFEGCVRMIPDADGFRLPTEAEWECACRAGSGRAFWSGEAEMDLTHVGWYEKNSGGETHPVREKPANPFGLFDMHGNVRELCWDWLADGYPRGLASDPTGPEVGFWRVWRGGDYALRAEACRSAFRDGAPPMERTANMGFRPVVTLS